MDLFGFVTAEAARELESCKIRFSLTLRRPSTMKMPQGVLCSSCLARSVWFFLFFSYWKKEKQRRRGRRAICHHPEPEEVMTHMWAGLTHKKRLTGRRRVIIGASVKRYFSVLECSHLRCDVIPGPGSAPLDLWPPLSSFLVSFGSSFPFSFPPLSPFRTNF